MSFLVPKKIRSLIFSTMLLTAGLLVLMMGGKHSIVSQARAQAPGSTTVETSGSRGQVLEIDVSTLRRLIQMDPNLYLVDVRETDELTGPLGHIKQAAHVPLGEVLKNPAQFPRNKTLVFICRSGRRSRTAAQAAADSGRVAYSVKGGMRAWNKLSDQKPVAEPAETNPKQQERKIPLERDDGPDSIERDMGC